MNLTVKAVPEQLSIVTIKSKEEELGFYISIDI